MLREKSKLLFDSWWGMVSPWKNHHANAMKNYWTQKACSNCNSRCFQCVHIHFPTLYGLWFIVCYGFNTSITERQSLACYIRYSWKISFSVMVEPVKEKLSFWVSQCASSLYNLIWEQNIFFVTVCVILFVKFSEFISLEIISFVWQTIRKFNSIWTLIWSNYLE